MHATLNHSFNDLKEDKNKVEHRDRYFGTRTVQWVFLLCDETLTYGTRLAHLSYSHFIYPQLLLLCIFSLFFFFSPFL